MKIDSESIAKLKQNYRMSELLDVFNTDLQDEISSACVSIYQCRLLKSPKLITIEYAYGKDAVILTMRTHLIRVSEFVGVRDKIGDWQMKALCSQLYGAFPNITLTEFILFCARLRAGKYGKFYGSVDPQMVIQAFDEFIEGRKHDYIEGRNNDREAQMEFEEQESTPASRCDVERMLAEGKLPNLDNILRNGAKNKGKGLLFYESIQELIHFKQNNS